jgi:hypothetical protein
MAGLLETAVEGSFYKYKGETTELYVTGGIYRLYTDEKGGNREFHQFVHPISNLPITENGDYDCFNAATVSVSVIPTTESREVTPTKQTQEIEP